MRNCNCHCCITNRSVMHFKFEESLKEYPDLQSEVQLLHEVVELIADGSISAVVAPQLCQKVLEKIKNRTWEN